MPAKMKKFPVATELLTEALERLEQDHYSDGQNDTCDGCQRAAAVKRERDALERMNR